MGHPTRPLMNRTPTKTHIYFNAVVDSDTKKHNVLVVVLEGMVPYRVKETQT